MVSDRCKPGRISHGSGSLIFVCGLVLTLPSVRSVYVLMTQETEKRRLPAPWTVSESEESFCVRDANGLALAYVYFAFEEERRRHMGRLTPDEAWRVAANIAKLPELLKR